MTQLTHEKPPLAILWAGTGAFALFSFGALYLFTVKTMVLLAALASRAETILFNKGAFYLMGAGLGLGALAIYMAAELWYGASPKRGRALVGVMLAGVALMFFLPQAVHYTLQRHLEQHGFTACEQASHRWLHYQEIVFVANATMCTPGKFQ